MWQEPLFACILQDNMTKLIVSPPLLRHPRGRFRKSIRWCLHASLTVLTLAGQPAAADATATDKKLKLVEHYLVSKTAERIRESGNADATQLLKRAAELLARARERLAAGDVADADVSVAQALRSFSSASTAMTRARGSTEELKKRNAQLRNEVAVYRDSFRASLLEKGPSFAGLLDDSRLDALLARAQKLTAANKHVDASKPLQDAYDMTVAAVTRLRNNETVVYALDFQTPADEFRYESNRNQSYELLVQQMTIAGAESGSRSAAPLVERFVEDARNLKEQADDQAARGDYEQAIKTMEGANKSLVRALRMMGMSIPG